MRRLVRAWAALVVAGLAVTATLAAHGAWRAIAAHPRGAVAVAAAAGTTLPMMPAAVTVAAPLPAVPSPATGTTGTIALPALPVLADTAAMLAASEPGVVAARPFQFGRASADDRARALACLTDTIYYEAATEPDAGQQAVAQVVLNRVRHPAFPATVCGVVFQGSERAGCQFSFACDGAMARTPSRAAWWRAARVAAAALAGYVYAPVGLATHYHTYAVTPAWNRSLVMTDAVGAHFFHRWKGYWGTAAAFRQVYVGGEPVPGPHAPVLAAPTIAVAAAVIAPPLPVTAATAIRPAYRASGTMLAAAPDPGDHLPPASTVLDRWKDSGKPIGAAD